MPDPLNPFAGIADLTKRITDAARPDAALSRVSAAIGNMTNPNWTSEIFKAVVQWIKGFEETLDQEHEVGVRLVSFGQEVQFHLEAIEYSDSPLLKFRGILDNGQPVELIQHVSQISILLTKLPKKSPGPALRIGLQHAGRASPP